MSLSQILKNAIFCHRLFDSIEGRETIKKKDDLMMLMKMRESAVLAQWSANVTDIIHSSTVKNLLIKTEKGLITTNFDENVSMQIIVLNRFN